MNSVSVAFTLRRDILIPLPVGVNDFPIYQTPSKIQAGERRPGEAKGLRASMAVFFQRTMNL